MFPTLKKFLRTILIFILIFAWIFSGWPQIWKNPPFPPAIQEARASTTITNSPSSNTGSAWTNPTNAYADDSSYANITAGNPSGSNVWGNYGFSLSGSTITQVRVRYDAWSVGVSGQSVTRQATSDLSNTGGFTTSPLFSKINDSSDSTMIVGTTNAGGRVTFGFTAFAVPTNSTIQSIAIHYRHRSTTTSNAYAHGAAIKVGSTYYSMKDTAGWDTGHTTGVASGSAIEDHIYTGTTDPSTGAAWTVSAVNALTEFGVASTDFNPDANFYQVDITVNYTEIDDQIKVDVSWNGGSNWSSTQNTTMTSAEATTWYDVTGATSWTPANLVDGQLQVRALAQSVNSAEVVRLDWLPVEVTYTPPGPSITTPSSVQMPNYTLGGVGYAERNFEDVSALVQVTAYAGFTVTVSSTNLGPNPNNTILNSSVKLKTDGTASSNPTKITNCTGFSGITETASGEYSLDSARTIVTTSSGSGTCDIYPTIRVYISNSGTYVEQDSGTLTFTVTSP